MKIMTRKQALAEGKKTYYTGTPCCRGHKTWRWVSNYICSACYEESYDRMKESILKKYGKEKGLEVLREKFRKGQQQFRDQSEVWTTYIREYMQEYRHDEVGRKNCKKAAAKYSHSAKGKETAKKWRESPAGIKSAEKAYTRRSEKRKAAALERRLSKTLKL